MCQGAWSRQLTSLTSGQVGLPCTEEESFFEFISRFENLKEGVARPCGGNGGGVAGGERGDCGLLVPGDGDSSDTTDAEGVVGGLAGKRRELAVLVDDLATGSGVGFARSGCGCFCFSRGKSGGVEGRSPGRWYENKF